MSGVFQLIIVEVLMIQQKSIYLVMVTPDGNHNKYYRMIPNVPDAAHFTAEYGRVGATCMKKIYPLSSFDNIYEEKLKKGYIDKSSLHNIHVSMEQKYAPIADPSVNWLVQTLLDCANKAFKAKYVCSMDSVSVEMIEQAQNLILDLSQSDSVVSFNNILLSLYTVIPRRISNVNESLAKEPSDMANILEKEQALLDFTNGQTHKNKTIANVSTTNSQTYLDSVGVQISECSDEESGEILKYLKRDSSFNPKLFYKAFRVSNSTTEQHFQNFLSKNHLNEKKDTRMYYHGSNNRNWDGLIVNGPLLNPNAICCGKNFGQGIYFANSAEKSRRYTSMCDYVRDTKGNLAFIGVYKVAIGKPLHVKGPDLKKNWKHFSQKDIIKLGRDCLYAHKNVNYSLYHDEIVIFREEQATIRYLIALKS